MAEQRDPERVRLAEADRREQPWRRWGPYLSERAWGTVREDYSADGDAWSYLSFDQAPSRAFRWSEDGMAGICDDQQLLCMALSLWNGQDPILKDRPFGLTGEEGNHGEDAKDYWWYLDATPTSSWLEWRYHYPQAAFPYDDLRATNRARSRSDPEYELLDTGVFDGDRYWAVTVRWAKAGPEDLLWSIEVQNAGPDPATIDVLPTIWYRNRWRWSPDVPEPRLALAGPTTIRAGGTPVGDFVLEGVEGGDALFCDNETNTAKLFGTPGPAYPKDGIADHVIAGAATVDPEHTGTKAALRYRVEVEAGGRREIRLRFRHADAAGPPDLDCGFDEVMAARRADADAFFSSVSPLDASEEERRVLRQASAGMLWSKQFFHYDVERWLDGDPGQPPPPPQRRSGRNAEWKTFNARDVISMPDPWEYPWFAAWDLAFHCIALAHLDPEFAKRQLILLDREWYMHPNGQLPAYEWNFSDVNPPVQAWAALRVFSIDVATRRRFDPAAAPDYDFLERIFHKLLLNFTWWVNRKDASGSNVFEGGFLGLDNIGLFDRSKPLPVAGRLEQSDGTAWMAMYCLDLLGIALILARTNPAYEDVASKFFEHFTYIASAMEDQGLWDKDDGFFYDVIALASGERIPLRVRSMVGVVPLFAATILDADVDTALPAFAARVEWFCTNKPAYGDHVAHMHQPGHADRRLLSVVDQDRLVRVLAHCLNPDELLSDHGLRSLSRRHSDYPFTIDLGGTTASIDYEPAESTNYLFGGNSNWRGPVWMPLNYLAIESLRTYDRYFGPSFTVEYPTGSGTRATLGWIADDLARRLVGLWLPDDRGRRPAFGGVDKLQNDPAWKDLLVFNEYFHGDNGAGLGASHQTGWTGLVLDLIAARRLLP
ncbi:hypothetical protein K6U06_08445 [Acidiferrimicrobium sp. IK]|uniref:MGH1-like glycoside hydrolase domain-containing protein n=1 Tax=Acidiferrimicrobium sp. IK TaxID=2871700 RepID=UPI0021CAEECD|nr:hypothetical protein [Acidiferrimicrobium sp. IK]MCU4184388.1 hypothetical protein [Acidiferrimicrobium sp. IK]